MAIGDFNGDGIADLAVANSSNTVTILLGNGDEHLRLSIIREAGEGPDSIAVGDFNGDGKPDLGSTNSRVTNSINSGWLRNYFSGQWRRNVYEGCGDPGNSRFPESVAAGDFNGDGKLDLAVTRWFSNTVTILLGNGDGTFTAATTSPATGAGPIHRCC